MDLLLQAAKVLELGDSDSGADRVTPKSTRGAFFHQYGKSRGDNSENSDGSLYGENGVGTSEDDSSSQHRNRIGGKSSLRSATKRQQEGQAITSIRHYMQQPLTSADTREVHNQLEKNRRRQLRECFNHLQQCVPSLENKRVATQSILQGAIKHIKNLKKKDVEQEREIQMLANRKCELKKKYDLERNKCSEEQQRLADALLKLIKAKRGVEDGHTSDSTTTASEGPEFSDDDKKSAPPAKTVVVSGVKVEGSRKRKLGPRAAINMVPKPVESSVSSQTPVAQQPTNPAKSSTVSSSSLALKHMLEQRKRNQMSVAAQVKSKSPDKIPLLLPATTGTKGSAKSVSSLTSSYPMISTRLASGLKSAPSAPVHLAPLINQPVLPASQPAPTAGHPTPSAASQAAAQQMSHFIGQPLQAAGSQNILSNAGMAANTPQSRLLKTVPMTMPGHSKRRKITESSSNNASQPSAVKIPSSAPQPVSTSALAVPRKQLSAKTSKNATLLSSPMTLLQPTLSAAGVLSEVKKMEHSQTTVSKILTTPVNTDLQGINYLGKSSAGNNAGTITMQSLASLGQTVDGALSSKLLSTVIPVSLASLFRGIPMNTMVSPGVSIAPTQISMTPAPQVSNANMPSSTVASLLTNQMHQSLATNLIFTTANKTDANPIASVPLSNNNARIATLLAAPSPYLNKNVIKPNSNTQHTSVSLSSAPTSTITLQDNSLKTVTLTPTLLPLSLSSVAGSNLSQGTQLRFFAPFSPNPVMAASLANGQVMPTVVQLGASGQMALLQNLIPAQHMQVQGPRQHHLLSQPIVVMATPGSSFNVTAASGSNTSSSAPSSTNIL